MDFKEAQQRVREFTKERAWDIITPAQRGAHLTREVGKLCEYILYHEGVTTKPIEMKKMPKQLGDVLFSLIALANLLEIDLGTQLSEAMRQDAIKYPAKETKDDALRSYSRRAKPFFEKMTRFTTSIQKK